MGAPYVGEYAKTFNATFVHNYPRSKSVLNSDKNKALIKKVNPKYANEPNDVLGHGDHDIDFDGVRP